MSAVISSIYLAWRAWAGRAPEDLDRCNVIFARLALWTLALGTILGAYWADFAWGRWWGWDRKETWALITAMIFLAALHIRLALPPRWQAPATAALCVVGGGAMLVNWFLVSYMPGMHSYA
jgi:ABC-type transport system involved in cytochrome c biogenesis permease subunit